MKHGKSISRQYKDKPELKTEKVLNITFKTELTNLSLKAHIHFIL